MAGLADSYSGTPVVQNVNCTGTAYNIGSCSNSSTITQQCRSSDRSVELRCYFVRKSQRLLVCLFVIQVKLLFIAYTSGSGSGTSPPDVSGDGMPLLPPSE